jgi:peptidoglycan/LPS O-acetylase OafA/YrhL
MNQNNNSGRIHSLDGLRAASILALAVDHIT